MITAESVSKCLMFGGGFCFAEENAVPDRVQLQTLVSIEGRVVLVDVDSLKNLIVDVDSLKNLT